MCGEYGIMARGDNMPYDGYTAVRAAANKRYLDKQAWIKIRTDDRHKGAIQASAEAAGQSVNAYVIQAIQERMEREKGGQDET